MSRVVRENENLENLLAPFCYSPESALPPTNPGSYPINNDIHFRGYLSQDGQWGCVYNRSQLQCFPVQSSMADGYKNRSPIVICTETFQFPGNILITSLTELVLHNQKTTLGISKLLLGLSVMFQKRARGGLIIFDPITAKPLKFIVLPEPVSSVTVLSHFEEGGSNRPFFNEAMMAMVGIAAVGMSGGQVLIVDLALDDPYLTSFHSPGNSPPIFRNIFTTKPHRALIVDPHESNIATKRHHAVAKLDLIALSVDDSEEGDDETFNYCTPQGQVMKSIPKCNASVTCLEYIPALGSLAIGFAFGGFQLLRVDNLNLIYSSSLPSSTETKEIFGFSFAQPVDDPRNFCYLWVVYGRPGMELKLSRAELHSFGFKEKPYVENFGFVYDELMVKACGKRFTLELEDYFDDESAEEDEIRRFVRPLRIRTDSERNLTYMFWESRRSGLYYIGIFDMNQWYSNHMLDHIRYDQTTGLCPYWVAIPVETVEVDDSQIMSNVWDVQVLFKTVERWENPHLTLDIHLFPASISFQAITLTNTGVSTLQHFGIQEKLLRKLLNDGSNLMINPSELRKTFKMYGLKPVFPLRYDHRLTQNEGDRYYILSVLLESRRPSIIIQFAFLWLDGSYANVGCTVDMILEWIGVYTTAVRSRAAEHWENLLGFRNQILPPETPHFINYSNFLWNSLLGVLTTVTREDEDSSPRESYVEDLSFALSKLVQYSASLLMMYKAEILPERDDMDCISILIQEHEARRQQVKQAVQSCEFLDQSLKQVRPMMIDYLLEVFDEDSVREQWNVEPDENLYPPKHIGYILNMFMWTHENPKDIARVVAYFLLDVVHIVNTGERARVRGDFQSVMQLSAEEQAEVYNLWLLDHGYIPDTLIYLSQQNRYIESDDLPWSAALVVSTAFKYDEDVLEILQKSCPPNLGKLYINFMSKFSSHFNTLSDSICSEKFGNTDELLTHFFDISNEKGYLGDFINNRARRSTPRIVEALIGYLKNRESIENDDRLLSLYIQLKNYDMVKEQYATMMKRYQSRLISDPQYRWTMKTSLVNHFLRGEKKTSVLQFLKSTPTPMQMFPAFGTKAPLVIRAEKAPTSPPSYSNNLELGVQGNTRIPPQLRRLQDLKSKPKDPLSPLRRYAERLNTMICPTPGKSVRLSVTSMHQSRSFSRRASLATADKSVPNIVDSRINSLMNDSFTSEEDAEVGERIEEGVRGVGNRTVNLEALLELPSVDHRVGRKSTSFFGVPPLFEADEGDVEEECENQGNATFFYTPSADGRIHSIMKKEDTPRRNVELRFLDVSNDTIEEEMEDAQDSSLEQSGGGADMDISNESNIDQKEGDDDEGFEKVQVSQEKLEEEEFEQVEAENTEGLEKSIDEGSEEDFEKVENVEEEMEEKQCERGSSVEEFKKPQEDKSPRRVTRQSVQNKLVDFEDSESPGPSSLHKVDVIVSTSTVDATRQKTTINNELQKSLSKTNQSMEKMEGSENVEVEDIESEENIEVLKVVKEIQKRLEDDEPPKRTLAVRKSPEKLKTPKSLPEAQKSPNKMETQEEPCPEVPESPEKCEAPKPLAEFPKSLEKSEAEQPCPKVSESPEKCETPKSAPTEAPESPEKMEAEEPFPEASTSPEKLESPKPASESPKELEAPMRSFRQTGKTPDKEECHFTAPQREQRASDSKADEKVTSPEESFEEYHDVLEVLAETSHQPDSSALNSTEDESYRTVGDESLNVAFIDTSYMADNEETPAPKTTQDSESSHLISSHNSPMKTAEEEESGLILNATGADFDMSLLSSSKNYGEGESMMEDHDTSSMFLNETPSFSGGISEGGRSKRTRRGITPDPHLEKRVLRSDSRNISISELSEEEKTPQATTTAAAGASPSSDTQVSRIETPKSRSGLSYRSRSSRSKTPTILSSATELDSSLQAGDPKVSQQSREKRSRSRNLSGTPSPTKSERSKSSKNSSSTKRGTTPTPDKLESEEDVSAAATARRMTRSQKRRLTSDVEEDGITTNDPDVSIFEASVIENVAPRRTKRSTRSRTPQLTILPVLEEDAVLTLEESKGSSSSSASAPPRRGASVPKSAAASPSKSEISESASISGKRTRRVSVSLQRSKTPSPAKTEKSEQPESSEGVGKRSGRGQKSWTPSPSKSEKSEQGESSQGPPKRTRRLSVSKPNTPSPTKSEKLEEPSEESVKRTRRVSVSSHKTPSPTKSEISEYSEDEGEDGQQHQTRSFASGKRRRLRNFKFSPDLSTVLETSDMSMAEPSFLGKTLPTTSSSSRSGSPASGSKSKGKEKSTRAKKTLPVPPLEEEEEEEAKPRKRSRKSLMPEDLDKTLVGEEVDDDAMSEVSVRSTRSTRSNASSSSSRKTRTRRNSKNT